VLKGSPLKKKRDRVGEEEKRDSVGMFASVLITGADTLPRSAGGGDLFFC